MNIPYKVKNILNRNKRLAILFNIPSIIKLNPNQS